jgi:hypothetical protein
MRSLLAMFVVLVALLPARAAEAILSFDSRIEVQTNGDLRVTETIKVNAEGDQIRRGIFRDFPTAIVDEQGNRGTVSFDLVSVKRNGNAEPYHTESIANAVRVYIGSADVFLDYSQHTYELTYVTDRQVRRFADHDEVLWNATGTEWVFPVFKAMATVVLPKAGAIQALNSFTGRFGSRANDAQSRIIDNGATAFFETTRPLGPREGMTVGVKLDKGVIAAPTAAQERAWYLRDRGGDLAAVGGLILAFLYYLYAWMRVGRDPPQPTMVPRWDLPGDVSPALSNYIWNKGLRKGGFPALSAAAINLAVKGLLVFDDSDGDMTLRRTDKTSRGMSLPIGEKTLFDKITGYGGKLRLTRAAGTAVQSLSASFNNAMENEHRSVFYRYNIGWIIPGVVISLVFIALAIVWGNIGGIGLAALFPTVVTGAIALAFVMRLAKTLRDGTLGSKVAIAVVGFALVTLVLNGGLHVVSALFSEITNPLLIGSIASLVLLNLLFFWLMGAPTPLGAERTGEIAGLRHYLSVAEKDRMNMLGSPQMSPQHYETLLPFAVALDVEKPWTNAFQSWLAAAVAAGVAGAAGYYGPSWMGGHSSGVGDFSDSIGNLGTSLADSFTASLPVQESSSSGFSGGGSSGGGGGGGGGGGW